MLTPRALGLGDALLRGGGRVSPMGLPPDARRQKTIAFCLDHRVALANALLKLGAVQNGDLSAAVPDETSLL